MSERVMRWTTIGVLAAAWLGVWGAWLPHETAGLTHNAIDMATWAAVLDEVRFWRLRPLPDIMRLSISLMIIALGVSLADVEDVVLRWALRLVAAVPILVMLPPYPEILTPVESEYVGRLLASLVGIVGLGVVLWLDGAAEPRRQLVGGILAGLSLLGAVIPYIMLRPPFALRYAEPIALGWGVVLFSLGMVLGSALFVRRAAA